MQKMHAQFSQVKAQCDAMKLCFKELEKKYPVLHDEKFV